MDAAGGVGAAPQAGHAPDGGNRRARPASGSQKDSHGQYVVAYADENRVFSLTHSSTCWALRPRGVSRMATRSFCVSQCVMSAPWTALKPSASICPASYAATRSGTATIVTSSSASSPAMRTGR